MVSSSSAVLVGPGGGRAPCFLSQSNVSSTSSLPSSPLWIFGGGSVASLIGIMLSSSSVPLSSSSNKSSSSVWPFLLSLALCLVTMDLSLSGMTLKGKLKKSGCGPHFKMTVMNKTAFCHRERRTPEKRCEHVGWGFQRQGRSEGGPGVPVNPLCKPILRKLPTIFRGENAMTIMFDTV